MDFSPYFLLPDGRLRSGWRVLIFVGLYIFAGLLSAWLLYGLLAGSLLAYSAAIQLVSTLAATWLMLRFFDRRPLLSVGLAPGRQALRDLGFGFGIGFVMVEAVIVVEVGSRMVVIEKAVAGNVLETGSLAGVCGLLLVAAASEEALFRGYPFQRLVEGVGGAGAIAISSILFGVLHGGNPAATILSVMNTVLAGIFFSIAYLKTRALWLPIGAHFAWNWTLAVSGFPVSGLELVEMPWRAVAVSETVWLYGGSYGPEGGVVGTLALAMGITFVVLRVNRRDVRQEKTSETAAGLDGSL